MLLIASRKYSFLGAQTLIEQTASDTLLKTGENAFLLHMTSGDGFERERVVQLDARSALLRINQTPDEYGLNWE